MNADKIAEIVIVIGKVILNILTLGAFYWARRSRNRNEPPDIR